MPLKAFRRFAFLRQVEEDIKRLEEIRPFVNEQGKIEEWSNLYARAFIAKLLLTK